MQIEYFEIPELPGKSMFRCEKMQASLAVERCSIMWANAHLKGDSERLWHCKGCAVGAKHAGVGDATLSPMYAASICARCHCGATRLIHGHLCVSCFNRQREKIKGRNARGNAPVTHPPLYRLAIKYQTGGRVKVLEKDNVVSSLELVVAALRDEPKQVTFAMMAARSLLPQMELFA